MRFNLLSLLLLVTVVALAVTLSLKRTPDKLMLIGGYNDTWELHESAGLECQWPDKSKPPKLSFTGAYQIAQSICSHLNSKQEETGFESWETVSVSLERLDEQKWAYFVRIEGTDFPEQSGQDYRSGSVITAVILLNPDANNDMPELPRRVRNGTRALS